MTVTKREIAYARRFIQEHLGDIPFRLFVRPEVTIDGDATYEGSATTHERETGISATIRLREDVVQAWAVMQSAWEKRATVEGFNISDSDYHWGANAHFVILHECAHVLAEAHFSDVFERYFAPHGIHEQEQFASALAYAMNTFPRWGGYHPPTSEQVAIIRAYLDPKTNRRRRRRGKIEVVEHPGGSFDESQNKYFAPSAACGRC